MGCVHSNANPIESAIASSKHKDNYVTNLEKPTSSSYIISPSINDKNDNEVTEGCSTPTTPITQSRKASLRSLAVSSSCEKPIPSLTVETLQVSWYNTPNPSQKGSPVIDNSSNDNNCAIETSGITKKFSYDDIRDTIPPTCPQTLSNLLSQADCADLTGLELTEEGSSRNSQFSVDDVRDTIPPTRGGCAMSALGSTGVAELEEDEEESDGIRDTIPPTRGGFAMSALGCTGIAELEEDEEGLALLTTSTVVTPSLEVIAEGDTEVLKPPVANEVNDSDISIVQAPDGEIVFEEVEKEEVWLVLMATVASVCTVNG